MFPTLLSSHRTIRIPQMPHVLTPKPCKKPVPYKPHMHQEEQEIRDSMYRFEGRDAEIITAIQHELEFKAGDVMEVDEYDDDTEDEAEELTTKEVMDLCQQMESLCIKHGSFDDSLGLAKHLQQYRIHLN